MNLEKSVQGEILVLKICQLERLDASSCGELRSSLLETIGEDFKGLVLDLSSLKHIDSSGLSVFISINKRLQSRRGEVKLCNLSPTVKSMFELTRLDKVFDIFEDREQAIESLNS